MDDPIQDAVRLLARLPGVGEKSARRMAYSILSHDPVFARALGAAVAALPERVRRCEQCGAFTGAERCAICRNPQRGGGVLCVVARPWDIDALERAGTFMGRYHVLHALLDPLGGTGPAEFPLGALTARLGPEEVTEVILATPS